MCWEEEFENAKALSKKHKKKAKKLQKELDRMTADWGSLEHLSLEAKLSGELAAVRRAEGFAELFNPF